MDVYTYAILTPGEDNAMQNKDVQCYSGLLGIAVYKM